MCDMLVQLLFSDKASDVPDSERLAPPQIRDTPGIKTVTNHGLESLFLPTGSAPQVACAGLQNQSGHRPTLP